MTAKIQHQVQGAERSSYRSSRLVCRHRQQGKREASAGERSRSNKRGVRFLHALFLVTRDGYQFGFEAYKTSQTAFAPEVAFPMICSTQDAEYVNQLTPLRQGCFFLLPQVPARYTDLSPPHPPIVRSNPLNPAIQTQARVQQTSPLKSI